MIRLFVVALLFGVVLLAIGFAGRFVYRRASAANWRFSLRALFGFVTLVAVLLAAFYSYRRVTMAQIRWIPADSEQAASIFPVAEVAVNDQGEYEFSYYTKRQPIQAMLRPLTKVSYRVDREAVRVAAQDEALANERLDGLRDADALPAGAFVIRGRVVDRQGEPLARATVDLMGSYVFINHFQTRDDGTFTMPLYNRSSKAPAGWGYYLRVRAKEETAENLVRWHTARFSLDSAEPELVAEIMVPR